MFEVGKAIQQGLVFAVVGAFAAIVIFVVVTAWVMWPSVVAFIGRAL